MAFHKSDFHIYREKYQPKIPAVFKSGDLKAVVEKSNVNETLKSIFPNLCKEDPYYVSFQGKEVDPDSINAVLRIGVVLSGGQAAGGHNVILGIYEYLKKRQNNSQLIGFLNGPQGIFTGKFIELREKTISYYKNRGGFDMICSGRHKIETEEQLQNSLKNCELLKLDGLIVIGGDDSNTNACFLAEYFMKNGCKTKVIGCPKTIDGDLKNEYVEVSFGFDTACKTYSEVIGNIELDTLSSKKYYHFIRLMGRSASHIALECALITRPNYTLIGEEVAQKGLSLHQIIDDLVDTIITRAKNGKTYGVVLVPEGLIEFIGEVNVLIKEINEILSKNADKPTEIPELFKYVSGLLTQNSAKLFQFLPGSITEQLLLDRDPHGNVQVAKIETEKLLISLVESELAKRQDFKTEFSAMSHYFGYEGRCAFPTNFDCDYCYSLGYNAGALIDSGFTGLMSVIRNLADVPDNWKAGGCPLVSMMDIERRKGKNVPVIKKALVDLNGPLFTLFAQERDAWKKDDYYRAPGPIQFEFPSACPFLVKPPEKNSLYGKEEIKYDEKFVPYAPIHPGRNVAELAKARVAEKVVLPKILESGDFQVVLSSILDYANEETKLAVQRDCKTLTSNSRFNRLVEFVPKSEILLSSQEAIKPVGTEYRIGIVFCGRQTPGAHNVISGLLEFGRRNKATILGFIGGTKGLFKQRCIEITPEIFQYYHNEGGFHLLGRTADKLRTPEELEATLKACQDLKLDGLIMLGATHTLTDSLLLTEYLINKDCSTRVIGVPATVDGNLYHHMLEAVIGFDTSTRLYSQMIGNIMIDAASAVKYWYFIRLMGRIPSHQVLECALQTQPNMVLISEEIASYSKSLNHVVNEICDLIVLRSQNGKEFGTLLVPEGLLQHISQFKSLIEELNTCFAKNTKAESEVIANKLLKDEEYSKKILTPWSAALFNILPDFFKRQLLLEREVNGSIQLSQLETERLLAHLVSIELKKRKAQKQYKGSFAPICHFFGYQGRCATPSKFDCNLANVYGYVAGVLIQHGITGYCTTARGCTGNISTWICGGIPLLSMTMVRAKSQYGINKTTIPSHEVDLENGPFLELKKKRESWKLIDYYSNPGPSQFFGEFSNVLNKTLTLSKQNYPTALKKLEGLIEDVKTQCRFGVHEDLLQVAIMNLQNLNDMLRLMKKNLK